MLLGVRHEIGAAAEVPFPPGRDDLDIGLERVGGQLETNLVVALAGGPVRDRLSAVRCRRLDEAAGDDGTRQCRSHEVVPLVDGVGPDGRQHAFLDECLP